MRGSGPAEIVGNPQVIGGDIISGANVEGVTHLYGTLMVEGNVTWTGGTYHPYVEAEVNNGSADLWYATGTFTIGGTAALAPTGISEEGNQMQPQSGFQ